MSDYDVHMHPLGGVPIKAWTKGVPIEASALDQLLNVSTLPFIHKHVAVMPDVHWGMGATVGSVIPTKGAIIPAAVGVDIGCGMVAVRTGLSSHDLPTNLKAWRHAIEKAVPHGAVKGASHDRGGFSQSDLPKVNGRVWQNKLAPSYSAILASHPKVAHKANVHQLGTLGSGNHFIEICLDESDRVWLMLHSGSRGLGNKIGMYFTALAKQEMKIHFINLPDKDLAYLPEGTRYFNDYIFAMDWAQEFAQINRDLMVAQVFDALKCEGGVPQAKLLAHDVAVNCHHNYTTREKHYGENVWLTRKGAVCARKGVMGIIPGSMGAKSFIVEGKGNPESFDSCSHGAGRAMSRTEAKKTFTLDDHIAATAGVECKKDLSVIDETPGAYKDIDAVMGAQSSLVEIKHTLKQVMCVKG
jgi:tRNA-splicing ligase RtcB